MYSSPINIIKRKDTIMPRSKHHKKNMSDSTWRKLSNKRKYQLRQDIKLDKWLEQWRQNHQS